MLIVLTGKSCSGKDTIRKDLIKRGIAKPIITYTTRPKRKGEKDGTTYHFVSDMEFLQMIQDGAFAEFKDYAVANGDVWMYGCAAADIERAEDENYVIILTPQGVRDLKVAYGHIPMKIFYVYANYKTLQNRLIRRGDDAAESKRRIHKDAEDFAGWENEADKIVYNNDDNTMIEVISKIQKYL